MKRAISFFLGMIMTCSFIGTASAVCADDAHSWDVGEVTIAPTCTEEGVIVYACTNEGCSATKTENIAANGHTADGNTDCDKVTTCVECGVVLKNAGEHPWDGGTVLTAPTCSEEGCTVYVCTNIGCNATKTETVVASGHISNGNTDCDKDTACTVCGAVLKASSEHAWNEGTVLTAPSCTGVGSKEFVCTECGKKSTQEIPATGHKLGEAVVVQTATCTRTGLKSAKCVNSGCSYKEETRVSKLNHTYVYGLCTCGAEMSVPFTDVNGHWAKGAIRYVYYRKIMNGVSATAFSPNVTLTRGMVVTILYNTEGKPEVSGVNPFSDVEKKAWYCKPVIWAAENNLILGMGNGRFAPNQSITREQLATIMRRYASFKGEDVSANMNLSVFSDAGKISAWAVGGMKWAVKNGVISGRGNGILDPLGSATRAECAQIIYNYLEK